MEHRIEIPIGSAKILPFFSKNRPLNRTDLQYDSCYCAFGRLVRFSCSKYTYRACYSVPILWIAKNFRKYFWRQKTPFFRTKAARSHFFLQKEKPERPPKLNIDISKNMIDINFQTTHNFNPNKGEHYVQKISAVHSRHACVSLIIKSRSTFLDRND